MKITSQWVGLWNVILNIFYPLQLFKFKHYKPCRYELRCKNSRRTKQNDALYKPSSLFLTLFLKMFSLYEKDMRERDSTGMYSFILTAAFVLNLICSFRKLPNNYYEFQWVDKFDYDKLLLDALL